MDYYRFSSSAADWIDFSRIKKMDGTSFPELTTCEKEQIKHEIKIGLTDVLLDPYSDDLFLEEKNKREFAYGFEASHVMSGMAWIPYSREIPAELFSGSKFPTFQTPIEIINFNTQEDNENKESNELKKAWGEYLMELQDED